MYTSIFGVLVSIGLAKHSARHKHRHGEGLPGNRVVWLPVCTIRGVLTINCIRKSTIAKLYGWMILQGCKYIEEDSLVCIALCKVLDVSASLSLEASKIVLEEGTF